MAHIDGIETIQLRGPARAPLPWQLLQNAQPVHDHHTVRTTDGSFGTAYNADSDEEQQEVLQIIHDESPRWSSVSTCWHRDASGR